MSTPPGLPPEVLDLVTRHLESMEQVELLLALHDEPSRNFTVGEIAELLRADPASVARSASALAAQHLAEMTAPAVYRYGARSSALHAAIDALAVAYRTRPVTLIRAVYERPSSSLRSFSDAFRFRKKED